MNRAHALLVALPLTLALVATACGDDDDAAEDAPPTVLPSSGWFLDSGLGVEIPDEVEVTIVFTEIDVAGHSGCNNYTGGYTVTDDGGIIFGALATTRKMCEPDLMTVEAAYLAALATAASYEISGDELIFSNAAGEEILRYSEDG